MLTVIIPSHNEENRIQACLDRVVAQVDLPAEHGIQVIVAANGCDDKTVAIAQANAPALQEKGFDLVVLDIPQGNKMNALNGAEDVATHGSRAFLDADVLIGPRMLREIADILAQDAPVYASGKVYVTPPQSIVTRAYAKVWTNLPFVRDGVPGIGLYAMNAAGRARWGKFPPIIADDRFVRLQFSPNERRMTNATHEWPLPEGFRNLVHVCHRWREGNMEVAAKYPDLLVNDSEINTTSGNMLGLLRTPFSAVIFVLIYVISKNRAKRSVDGDAYVWRRGRD